MNDDNINNQVINPAPPTPTPTSEPATNPTPAYPANAPQPSPTYANDPNSRSAANSTFIDRKIKFWKKFSIILGLISLIGYIIILVVANVLAHGTQYGWVIFMMFGLVAQYVMRILIVLLIVSLVRIIALSSQRKNHLFKDYLMVAIGLALIFSPFAISEILSFFRISWNEDNGISVTVKSQDPYYISGDTTLSFNCVAGYETSNDLKNTNINERYDDINIGERKLFATRDYVKKIGEEILCQVAEFYKNHGRYPKENEIKNFASKAVNDDLRIGVYDVKLETGAVPNDKDFTILFDTVCNNKKSDIGNVVVLSPHYGEHGRYCVYNDIDEIVDNLGKIKK